MSAADPFETIEVRHDGKVTWISLNRPQRLNAINELMLTELERALDDVARDPSHRVSVLRGAGRSFSAGFDVGGYALSGRDPKASPIDDYVDLKDRMRRLMTVWDHPKPVIAAVHGHCLAAATILAVFCDITVVAADAVIGLPALPLGGGFISPTWVHLVGPKRAKQMSFLAGSQISGEQAADWGWANYSVDSERLIEDVTELATAIARTPADILRVKKAAVNRMVDMAGLRTGALIGAEADVVAHQDPGIKRIQAAIAADGLKATLARFASGELEV